MYGGGRMLSWISSVIVTFIGSNKHCEKILCVNSRYIHLVEPKHGCDKVFDLRNNLLGNNKIKYIRRKIFGSKRHIVRQILKSTGANGEFVLSTLR